MSARVEVRSVTQRTTPPTPLSDRQIELVRWTYEAIRPLTRVATDMFFVRLFVLEPHAREHVGPDVEGIKSSIATLLAPTASALTERSSQPIEVAFATEPAVRDALVWTLERMLGHMYTTEVADAWCQALSSTCHFTRTTGDPA